MTAAVEARGLGKQYGRRWALSECTLSIPAGRWMAMKLALIGLAAMATTGLLSLMLSWWTSPLYQAAQRAAGPNALSISRFTPPLFGANGVAPIGYAAFAFALGVSVGVLIRRTLPAMAITLAVFAAIQILWPSFVRPHLIAPLHATQALGAVSFDGIGDFGNGHLLLNVSSVSGMTGDWITASHPVKATGQIVGMVPQACASINANFLQCLAGHGVRIAISYQPASRYWTFQWLETGIFLVLALGLGGVCYWRVRRVT